MEAIQKVVSKLGALVLELETDRNLKEFMCWHVAYN